MDITSLVSYNTGITLGHSIHQKKIQEAKAIIDMIKDTDITNAILTWDALNIHERTFKAAIDKGADVFACLKENQGSLYDDCITAYTEYKKGHLLYASTASQQIADYSHVEGGKHIFKNIVILDAKANNRLLISGRSYLQIPAPQNDLSPNKCGVNSFYPTGR